MINYKCIKGKNKKMLVVFQGMNYTKQDMEAIQLDSFSELNRQVHEKYSYYKLVKKHFADYNVLFIKDDFSGIVGWYYFDYDKTIINELSTFISNKYNDLECEELYLFGSSKGGFATVLYSMINKDVTKALSLCPQLDLTIPFEMFDTDFYKCIKKNVSYTYRKEELRCLIPSLCNNFDKKDCLTVISSIDDRYFVNYKQQLTNELIDIRLVKGKEHSYLVYAYGEYALLLFKDIIEGTNYSSRQLGKVKVRYFKAFLFKNISKILHSFNII